ncbi:MAG TPA: PstA family ABC transporter permease [Acidimicrobiales bacterium]|nr:PstA family ABC transporter permease [Acidimicrobiales bacterium]
MPGQRRRRFLAGGFRVGTYLALLLVLGPALWILGGVVARAVPHWRWDVLWTTLSGATGGLRGAILGTLILMAGVLVIAGTVGVLAGLHLAELAKPKKDGRPGGGVMRSAADVLSGFPSIVLGYVGYVALVVGLHWQYSLLPALLILSIMVVPYIAKSTETALRQVPTAYREGADALGMSMGYGLRKVVLKSAFPGIVTGLLIALAIAGGETAPLLYTAGWNGRVWTGAFVHGHGFTYLTYPVFTFFDYPNKEANYLAYDAALILMVIVLILLVASRIIVARTQRHAEGH